MYDFDEYHEVISGVGTINTAVADLMFRQHVVLHWADQRGTLLSVLLSFDPTRVGVPGGGVDGGPGKLWVGVAGHGCYAFGVGRGVLVADYVTEKLGVRGSTVVALAALLTDIRQELARVMQEMH